MEGKIVKTLTKSTCLLLWSLALFSNLASAGQPTVECTENLAEYKANGWTNLIGTGVEYAETSDDLPEELRGQIHGDGIFYMGGIGDGTWGGYSEGIKNAYYRRNFTKPIYMYMKYFGLSHNNKSTIRVSEVEDPDPTKYLEKPSNGSNFDWHEALVEIHYYIYGDIFLGMSEVYEGDYFLVDRLILAHGEVINDIEKIKGFCGWSEEEPATTEAIATEEPLPPVTVECTDDLDEYTKNGWRNLMGTLVEYADTQLDLPGELAGKLGGNGIFYMEGMGKEGEWGGGSEGIVNPYYYRNFTQPIYLYAKYFGLGRANGSQVRVTGAEHPDVGQVKYLENASNGSYFRWHEALVEIHYYRYGDVFLGMSDVYEGDFFLVDKLILSHGREIKDIEEIKGLCGWAGEEPSTTARVTTEGEAASESTTEEVVITTTTNATTTTTATPRPPFKCTATGYFPDPQDCTQFHLCEKDDQGGFTDSLFTCPAFTIWCQDEGVCDYPTECSCSV